jgi:H/ACA ribonucleoprotein complex non-core subunit NAF1
LCCFSGSAPLVVAGSICSIVDNMLIANAIGRTLDLGSAVCTCDRIPVGRIEEVIGQVTEPFYSIRCLQDFNISTLTIEMKLFYVPTLASFILADTRPGSDASNQHDEEINEHVKQNQKQRNWEHN